MDQRKRCTRCGKNKLLKLFPSNHATICNACRKPTVARERLPLELNRQIKLAQRYGLTEEDIAKMLDNQVNACAICVVPIDRLTLRIDHDHTLAGRDSVRGLVCNTCNGLLHYVDAAVTRLDANRAIADPAGILMHLLQGHLKFRNAPTKENA